MSPRQTKNQLWEQMMQEHISVCSAGCQLIDSERSKMKTLNVSIMK